MKKAGINLGRAFELGYIKSDRKKSRGYEKRNREVNVNTELYVAEGRRLGQLYYREPSYESTKYYYRVYLTKGDTQ